MKLESSPLWAVLSADVSEGAGGSPEIRRFAQSEAEAVEAARDLMVQDTSFDGEPNPDVNIDLRRLRVSDEDGFVAIQYAVQRVDIRAEVEFGCSFTANVAEARA